VLQRSVGGQNRVVRLDDRIGQSGCRVDTELKLGFLAIVGGEPLKDEGTETRARSTTERVEDEEALQSTAVVSEAADLVHHGVDLLLANRVVATGICWGLVQHPFHATETYSCWQHPPCL
jgi:hypothetical protein